MSDTPTPESDWCKASAEIGWAADTLGVVDNALMRLAPQVKTLQRERDEARAEVARLREALQRLADCDWVITPHDRMDAVRKIARDALEGVK